MGDQAAFISAGAYHHRLRTRKPRGGTPPPYTGPTTRRSAIWTNNPPTRCDESSKRGYRSRAPPITASAKRCTYETRTETVSSFTATVRARSGRSLRRGRVSPCSRDRSTSKRSSQRRNSRQRAARLLRFPR
jgi:hypothetical protein